MIQGKTVMITGCNRGIGKALVEAFLQAGNNVLACQRKPNPEFDAWAEEIAKEKGVWLKSYYFDLADKESTVEGVQNLLSENDVDVLVNNAGVSAVGLLMQANIDEIEQLFAINFFSMLRIIQKVSKKMMRKRKGCIINIASIAAFEAQPGKIAYGCSKAAVVTMTKNLAKELGPMGIRVNAIAPGPTKTDIMEQFTEEALKSMYAESALRKIGSPEEIANVALFLASDEASYIDGAIIRVDGGR